MCNLYDNYIYSTLSNLLWNLVDIPVKRNFSRHEVLSTNTQQPRSSFCVGGSSRGEANSKRSALVYIYIPLCFNGNVKFDLKLRYENDLKLK